MIRVDSWSFSEWTLTSLPQPEELSLFNWIWSYLFNLLWLFQNLNCLFLPPSLPLPPSSITSQIKWWIEEFMLFLQECGRRRGGQNQEHWFAHGDCSMFSAFQSHINEDNCRSVSNCLERLGNENGLYPHKGMWPSEDFEIKRKDKVILLSSSYTIGFGENYKRLWKNGETSKLFLPLLSINWGDALNGLLIRIQGTGSTLKRIWAEYQSQKKNPCCIAILIQFDEI